MIFKKTLHIKDGNVNIILFNGTRSTTPEKIYYFECGFDIQFSNSAIFGKGAYFASQHYSLSIK